MARLLFFSLENKSGILICQLTLLPSLSKCGCFVLKLLRCYLSLLLIAALNGFL